MPARWRRWSNRSGFGRSSGQRGYGASFEQRLDDVAWAIHQQRARYPGLPLILFGHSMGGLIATRYVQSERTAPDFLVLSGAELRHRRRQKFLGMGNGVVRVSA